MAFVPPADRNTTRDRSPLSRACYFGAWRFGRPGKADEKRTVRTASDSRHPDAFPRLCCDLVWWKGLRGDSASRFNRYETL